MIWQCNSQNFGALSNHTRIVCAYADVSAWNTILPNWDRLRMIESLFSFRCLGTRLFTIYVWYLLGRILHWELSDFLWTIHLFVVNGFFIAVTFTYFNCFPKTCPKYFFSIWDAFWIYLSLVFPLWQVEVISKTRHYMKRWSYVHIPWPSN